MSLASYSFYNKDWFIAAEVVKHYNLSSNYNTYYSKCFSNGRLYGPVTSYEFRLSGSYLKEFKELYGANNTSLNKSEAVWLIDEETVRKLLNREIINSKEKTVKTVESNALSIKYNLGIEQNFEDLKVKLIVENKEPVVLPTLNNILLSDIKEGIIDNTKLNNNVITNSRTIEEIRDYKSSLPTIFDEKLLNSKQLSDYITSYTESDKTSFISTQVLPKEEYKSNKEIIPITYSKYSEEEISDAITLLSSKLTNTPYQQEKLLEGGSIRLDLFSSTRRSVYAIELKKNLITLDMIKEKLEAKHYLTSIIDAYPDLSITFIFSSPMGISWEGFLYLQEASRSVGPHKIIYKPCSNLILDMINKKEKELPSYYYKQILDKPIIKYLLQIS